MISLMFSQYLIGRFHQLHLLTPINPCMNDFGILVGKGVSDFRILEEEDPFPG